jgi:hypothetical protein
MEATRIALLTSVSDTGHVTIALKQMPKLMLRRVPLRMEMTQAQVEHYRAIPTDALCHFMSITSEGKVIKVSPRKYEQPDSDVDLWSYVKRTAKNFDTGVREVLKVDQRLIRQCFYAYLFSKRKNKEKEFSFHSVWVQMMVGRMSSVCPIYLIGHDKPVTLLHSPYTLEFAYTSSPGRSGVGVIGVTHTTSRGVRWVAAKIGMSFMRWVCASNKIPYEQSANILLYAYLNLCLNIQQHLSQSQYLYDALFVPFVDYLLKEKFKPTPPIRRLVMCMTGCTIEMLDYTDMCVSKRVKGTVDNFIASMFSNHN